VIAHMPSGITQWYLPSGRADIPPFIPAVKPGTQFSDTEGCKAELAGYISVRYTCQKLATHPCTNRARRRVVSTDFAVDSSDYFPVRVQTDR